MSLWDELLAPPQLVAGLQREASSPQPTHAWLFTGAAGSLNRRAATLFAATLLCEQPNLADRGCGTCRSCLTVLNGSHADFTHFRTEAVNISIDEARELVVKAQASPSVSRWRVLLLEDTERMPERTSNVLLKAVEEPPPHTIWLLTAPSPTDVLITIRSRCRPVQLPAPTVEALTEHLQAGGVEPHLAHQAATLAAGDAQAAHRLATVPQALIRRQNIVQLPLRIRSIASAMDAAEQLMLLAEQDAAEAAAERDAAERAELLAMLGVGEGERVAPTLRAQVRRLEEQQKRRAKRIQTDTLVQSINAIQSVLRDALTVQLGAQVPLVNEHAREQLHEYAARTTVAQTLQDVQAVDTTLRRLRTVNARLALEALMSRFVR